MSDGASGNRIFCGFLRGMHRPARLRPRRCPSLREPICWGVGCLLTLRSLRHVRTWRQVLPRAAGTQEVPARPTSLGFVHRQRTTIRVSSRLTDLQNLKISGMGRFRPPRRVCARIAERRSNRITTIVYPAPSPPILRHSSRRRSLARPYVGPQQCKESAIYEMRSRQPFRFSTTEPGRSRIFVAPVRDKGAVPEQEWITIADTGWDDKPRWSPDGNTLYFVSQRDGFRCIWAQRLDSRKRPLGAAIAVFHAHESKRFLSDIGPGDLSISVARDKIVFNMSERTGNLWVANLDGRR